MSGSLLGKVAIVTGASKGIGRATSLRLAKDGATVVVGYGSDSSAADALVKEIGADRALAVGANMSTVAGAEKMVNETVAKYGKIDILVANAGILPMRTLANTTEADFDSTFALNVKGPYFLVQKAVPHMPDGSHIVLNSTSLLRNSTAVLPPYLLYNATKGSIEQMTRVLCKELASKKICVNCIAPGPTGTELFMKGKSQQILDAITSSIAFGRLAEPEEIADVVHFLSSDASRWMTGQVVQVNGGQAPSA